MFLLRVKKFGFMLWKYETPYYRHKGTLVTCVFGYVTPLYQLQFDNFFVESIH